jgi:hypothetical protein
MNFLSLLGISTIFSYIPWQLIFLILNIFGIRCYNLRNKEECQRIQKRIGERFSSTTDGGKGEGYALGYWYILYASMNKSDHGDNYSVWLIATLSSYIELTADKFVVDDSILTEDDKPTKTNLKVYSREGSFYNNYFKNRTIEIATIEPYENQEKIMNEIKNYYEGHDNAVAYIHGPPGTGKSLISILLANSYKSSYCNTLKPWQPGDTISNLYAEVEPTKDQPLILVFDEFDTALLKIHAGIEQHKNLPLQVQDKTGWNQMLDEIQLGMYPNMILIMTSNKSPEFIQALDPSYIRKGRVNVIAELC